jgi:acetyl-CoA synthetase
MKSLEILDMEKKDKNVVETSEAQIAVHWGEEEYFQPPSEFVGQANLTDSNIFKRFSLDNFPEYYNEFAELLTWDKYWDQTLDTSDAPCFKWFTGGRLNASYNCIDRHLAKNKNKTAIHFVPELEEEKIDHVTYQELYVRVNEMAALLRDFAGLKTGDRVTIHMPMSAELPITMLACARLGVIHSVVFGGFSASACADRIVDSQSRVLLTMDAYYRGGKLLNHKAAADEACAIAKKGGQTVDKVLVWQRYPGKASSETPMIEGRDYFVNDTLKEFYGARVEPVFHESRRSAVFDVYQWNNWKAEGMPA